MPPVKPPVPTEWKKIDIDYNRKIALTQARPWLERLFWLATLFAAFLAAIAFFLLIIWYLANGTFADRSILASLGSGNTSLHNQYQNLAPKDLQVVASTVLTFGGQPSSVVKLKNSNSKHLATAYYHDSGRPEKTLSQVIFPGSEAWLIVSGEPGHRVVVDKTDWQLISPRDISDPAQFLADRSAFLVSDISVSDKTLKFNLTNETSYSFWNAVFFVELSRGGSVFSVERLSLQDFESGSVKPVIIGGTAAFPLGVSVKIIPALDWQNGSIYKSSPTNSLDSRE